MCDQLVEKTVHPEGLSRLLLGSELPLESALAIASQIQQPIQEVRLLTQIEASTVQVGKTKAIDKMNRKRRQPTRGRPAVATDMAHPITLRNNPSILQRIRFEGNTIRRHTSPLFARRLLVKQNLTCEK